MYGKTFLGERTVDKVCTIAFRIPGLDCYLLRLYLPKLAKHASLIQITAINPASLLVCIQEPCLSVQLCIINILYFQGAVASPSERGGQFPAFLCDFSPFPCLHSQVHPWSHAGYSKLA